MEGTTTIPKDTILGKLIRNMQDAPTIPGALNKAGQIEKQADEAIWQLTNAGVNQKNADNIMNGFRGLFTEETKARYGLPSLDQETKEKDEMIK